MKKINHISLTFFIALTLFTNNLHTLPSSGSECTTKKWKRSLH